MWVGALARRLGAPVTVVARAPLTGGYASAGVELVELDVGGRARTVVLKQADAVEIAAMRAVAVVRGTTTLPEALAIGSDRLVLPYVAGRPLAGIDPFPDAVWADLARVHAHWWRKRPRDVPVVDAAWWRGLCGRTLVALRGGAARTGERAYATAVDAVTAWRSDEHIAAALALLPRTLVHGDPHRGNVLVTDAGPVLLDWGNARVAPGAVDVAVPSAEEAARRGSGAAGPGGPPAVGAGRAPAGGAGQAPEAYARELVRLGVTPPLPDVARPWAWLHVHVQYLGFAADHLGAGRVAEMVEAATEAHGRLASALAQA